LVKINFWAKL